VSRWLRHPLLDGLGVEHGFGLRGAVPPPALVRPRQVHGTRVIRLSSVSPPAGVLGEGDAIVSSVPGLPVGVVTADCLPLLLAAPTGPVAAVHAGWRGLAAGVVAAACEALAHLVPDLSRTVAALGPHVGPCCYEVDAPVVDALGGRFGAALDAALEASRPGHWRLALAALARVELEAAGLSPMRIGTLEAACTACDPVRFESFRRAGAAAGRLHHFVTAFQAL
jgi:YfiH family protein